MERVLCRDCDMAFSVNGDFGKDDRSSAKVIDKRHNSSNKGFELLAFKGG